MRHDIFSLVLLPENGPFVVDIKGKISVCELLVTFINGITVDVWGERGRVVGQVVSAFLVQDNKLGRGTLSTNKIVTDMLKKFNQSCDDLYSFIIRIIYQDECFFIFIEISIHLNLIKIQVYFFYLRNDRSISLNFTNCYYRFRDKDAHKYNIYAPWKFHQQSHLDFISDLLQLEDEKSICKAG